MKPLARKDELVIQEMGGEILVYDLRTDRAICLNQTSALVWQNCDGKSDALAIAKNIEKELGSKVTEDFVWFAINQLKDESLLENKTLVNRFEGMSRREVVKRIGLTSAIAIPVVASLIAPMAIHAQTCSGSCTCATDVGMGNQCTTVAGAGCAGTCRCIQTNNGNSAGTCMV